MSVLDLLFPKRCVGCGRFGAYVCPSCRGRMHPILWNERICPICGWPAIDGATHPRCRTRYSPDGLISLFHYNGVVKRAVKAIKYRSISDMAGEFVACIPDGFIDAMRNHHDGSVLCPVPLHPSRFRARGFNQTEVLARALSERLGMSCTTHMVVRVRATIPQVTMVNRNERIRNMTHAFAVREVLPAGTTSVLLIDDVFTTGATMRAAAIALKRAGVRRVWAVTMAR